jgi:hypothetical protein
VVGRSLAIAAWLAGSLCPAGANAAGPPASAPAAPDPAEPAPAPLADPALEAPPVEGPAPAAPPDRAAPIYAALVGNDLALTMRDQTTFRGRLLAVQPPWLLCAREGDGRVVAVLQGEVAKVRAVTDEPGVPVRIETGVGRRVAGITLIGSGVVMAIGAAWGGVYGGGVPYYWLPLALPAIVAAGVGIPLLIRGIQIGKQAREAQAFLAARGETPRTATCPSRSPASPPFSATSCRRTGFRHGLLGPPHRVVWEGARLRF